MAGPRRYRFVDFPHVTPGDWTDGTHGRGDGPLHPDAITVRMLGPARGVRGHVVRMFFRLVDWLPGCAP